VRPARNKGSGSDDDELDLLLRALAGGVLGGADELVGVWLELDSLDLGLDADLSLRVAAVLRPTLSLVFLGTARARA
jgi:hypothetical protein